MNIRQIYTYALQREREGKRFFEDNAARAAHAAAAGVFRTLAEEEDRHISYIEALLRHLGIFIIYGFFRLIRNSFRTFF